MSAPVLCPHCSTPVPVGLFNAPAFSACPACAASIRVRLFPAVLRPAQQGQAGERITDVGQAACFYHPHKTAHVPCDACGRFICALCDVELHGQHLCPSCVESGRRKGTLTTLENKRVLWDNIALSIAVVPTLLCGWLAIVTCPTAIVLAIVGWRKPGSLAPRRTRLRFVCAVAFAILALAGWGFLWWYLRGDPFGTKVKSFE